MLQLHFSNNFGEHPTHTSAISTHSLAPKYGLFSIPVLLRWYIRMLYVPLVYQLFWISSTHLDSKELRHFHHVSGLVRSNRVTSHSTGESSASAEKKNFLNIALNKNPNATLPDYRPCIAYSFCVFFGKSPSCKLFEKQIHSDSFVSLSQLHCFRHQIRLQPFVIRGLI